MRLIHAKLPLAKSAKVFLGENSLQEDIKGTQVIISLKAADKTIIASFPFLLLTLISILLNLVEIQREKGAYKTCTAVRSISWTSGIRQKKINLCYD